MYIWSYGNNWSSGFGLRVINVQLYGFHIFDQTGFIQMTPSKIRGCDTSKMEWQTGK